MEWLMADEPSGDIETRRGGVARRRAELAYLNSQSYLSRSLEWHAGRLAEIAAIEQEIKDLEEKL
jgi:hypothetical protein